MTSARRAQELSMHLLALLEGQEFWVTKRPAHGTNSCYLPSSPCTAIPRLRASTGHQPWPHDRHAARALTSRSLSRTLSGPNQHT